MKSTSILGLAALTMVICGCYPAQKDPRLATNHTREDAKVDQLTFEASHPLVKGGVTTLWKKTTGKTVDNQRVKIGVVGTGIDYTIADLRDALWTNLGELGDDKERNGLDDDNNGVADDVVGWDFSAGDSTPFDWHGHDTFTASVIAATARTNPKTVGVAPNAELVVARYLDSDGRGDLFSAISAIDYVVGAGAKIVYLNLPQGGLKTPVALSEVISKSTGVLFVIPAGNSKNENIPLLLKMISNLPNVLVVAGLDANGNLTRFSNFGIRLATVAAPAVGLTGYMPGGSLDHSLETTSVAAAYAAGTAALMSTLPGMGSVAKIKEAFLQRAIGENRNDENPLDVLAGGPIFVGGL